MRGAPFWLVLVILLAAPASAAFPKVSAPAPLDIDDATLLRLLAGNSFSLPTSVSIPRADELPPLRVLVEAVALRTGAATSPDDFVMFEGLDARVDVPVRVMLAAIDQAWQLRDAAFSGLTHEEQLELAALTINGQLDSPRGLELVPAIDQEMLVQAAILLLDTAESVVVPALKDAVAQGAWPATATADPVGILRLGGTGNDVETLNRVLQIDPSGDDLYRNNAGGTNTGSLLSEPTAPRYLIALSFDFAGNDHYNKTGFTEAQGGGNTGIGILQDYEGNDIYYCGVRCQGAGSNGIGILHDHAGDDRYYGGQSNKGYAASGAVGILRDDHGSDLYACLASCGGFAFLYPSTGLLWDRIGADTYEAWTIGAFGWGDSSGRGWIVDEGNDADTYSTSKFGAAGHGCNDCTWLAGSSTNLPGVERGGRGNDGAGGLAFLMTRQGSGLV